jgi:hypothetical protein
LRTLPAVRTARSTVKLHDQPPSGRQIAEVLFVEAATTSADTNT